MCVLIQRIQDQRLREIASHGATGDPPTPQRAWYAHRAHLTPTQRRKPGPHRSRSPATRSAPGATPSPPPLSSPTRPEIREPARRALVAAGCRSSATSAGHTARTSRARRAGLDRPVAAHGQVERRQRSQDLPLGGVWLVYFGERPRKRAPRADWARFRARRRWGAPRVVGGWWGAAGRAPRAPGRAPARVFVLSLHAECGPNRCCR